MIDFNEGSGELTAELNVGKYTHTSILAEIKRAFEAVSANVYTVTINRSSRIIDIAVNTGTFKLLGNSGSNVTTSPFVLLGFAESDTSYAANHSGPSGSGYEWIPQFYPQDYVDGNYNQTKIDGVVRRSQSGQVEAVYYGTNKIYEMNFKYITNTGVSGVIDYQTDAVSNALDFMEYVTGKGEIEFMPDKSDTSDYLTFILESTPEDKDGLGFKLKELYSQGLVGWYETGVLKFRLIE